MADSGLEVKSILGLVKRSTPDEEVVRVIGASRFRVLMTKDSGCVAKDVFRNAIVEHRAGVFYIAGAGNLDATAIANIIIPPM